MLDTMPVTLCSASESASILADRRDSIAESATRPTPEPRDGGDDDEVEEDEEDEEDEAAEEEEEADDRDCRLCLCPALRLESTMTGVVITPSIPAYFSLNVALSAPPTKSGCFSVSTSNLTLKRCPSLRRETFSRRKKNSICPEVERIL